jgi:hypothetical protein
VQFAERTYTDASDINAAFDPARAATGVFTASDEHEDDGHYSFSPRKSGRSLRSSVNVSPGGAGAGGAGAVGGGGDSGLRVSVAALEAEFILDATDVLWFSHCKEVLVQLTPKADSSLAVASPSSPTRMAKSARAAARERGSAQGSANGTAAAVGVLGAELRRLCTLAESRGVDLAGSFRHFDERFWRLVFQKGLSFVFIKVMLSPCSPVPFFSVLFRFVSFRFVSFRWI